MYFGFRPLGKKNNLQADIKENKKTTLGYIKEGFVVWDLQIISSHFDTNFCQMLLVHKVLSIIQSAFIGKQEYFTSLNMSENQCLTTVKLDVYDYIFSSGSRIRKYSTDV